MQRILKAAQARNLDRIAVAYAVAGWLLVQGASIVLPAFDVPAWSLRAFIIAIVAGFPMTLAVGWFLSSTAAPAHQQQSRISHREVVLLVLLGAVLLLSIGELVFFPHRGGNAHSDQITPNEASIAVLPFVNMSGDSAKEYFSDGISEELLNDLANVPALRVAARTSSFAFKNRRADIKTIARQLGVGAVLEGSVRESGDRIRITAQLIKADDGFHLWSSTYDRQLSDILAVQADIAGAITKTLTRRLLPSADRGRASVTVDPQDYRDYLAAKHFDLQRTREGIGRAASLLEHVTLKEPRFADAFANLAQVYLNMNWLMSDRARYREKARAAIETALRIDPGNAQALYGLARMDGEDAKWHAATDDIRRLETASPNSALLLRAKSVHYFNLALFHEAAVEAGKSAQRDPLSPSAQEWLAYLLTRAGEMDAAIAAWKAALALQPWRDIALYGLCDSYAFTHRIAQARDIANDLQRIAPVDDLRECEAEIDVAVHDYAGARKIIDVMAGEDSRGQLAASEKASAYIQIGDFATAAKWAVRAYAEKSIVDLASLQYDQTLQPTIFFRGPEWKALAAKPELSAWEEERTRVLALLKRDAS